MNELGESIPAPSILHSDVEDAIKTLVDIAYKCHGLKHGKTAFYWDIHARTTGTVGAPLIGGCGKIGCPNPPIMEGWKGSLKVKACAEHASEVEDIFGNLPPNGPK